MLFVDFYRMYPRKVARKEAERAWLKLSDEEKRQAIDALPNHLRYWELKNTDKHFIPHPASWLNGARFEDELDLSESLPKNAVAWWCTDEGVIKKGSELGVRPRAGEQMPEFKARVIEAARKAA